MHDRPDADDPAFLRSVLEEESPSEPHEAAIAEALAEPVLAGIIARSMAPRVRMLTDKGRERMRRELAVMFLTVPRLMAVLAQARAEGASATVATGVAGATGGGVASRAGRRKTP